jgi:hypothetical protein
VPDSSSSNAAITASFPPRLSAAVFTFEHIRRCQNFLLLFARAYMIHLGYMMYKLNILIVLVKKSKRKKVYRTIAFFPKRRLYTEQFYRITQVPYCILALTKVCVDQTTNILAARVYMFCQ